MFIFKNVRERLKVNHLHLFISAMIDRKKIILRVSFFVRNLTSAYRELNFVSFKRDLQEVYI